MKTFKNKLICLVCIIWEKNEIYTIKICIKFFYIFAPDENVIKSTLFTIIIILFDKFRCKKKLTVNGELYTFSNDHDTGFQYIFQFQKKNSINIYRICVSQLYQVLKKKSL